MRSRYRLLAVAALLATYTLGFASAQTPEQNPKSKGDSSREIIIQFRTDAHDGDIAHAITVGRLKPKRHIQTAFMASKKQAGLTLVDSEAPVDLTLRLLQNHPAVEFAEPNVRYTHQAISNDPYFPTGYMWGVYGDLSSPANSFGSQAAEAWQAGYTGANNIYVAVLDEGIEVNHPDLAGNIWTNPFDPVDGIDNDGNGYVDDVNGWNFLGNNNQVFDPAGDAHGTHVAGTIGAKGGNSLGVAGINWNVSIIAGKFLGAGGGDTLDAVEAIDYFVDLKKRHGINLVAINASWGGSGYSQALHAAIIRAAKAGILFIAAAGNSGLNNDASNNYPANLDTRTGTSFESAASYDGVISVAAIDNLGALASFSNYGATKVDLGAPGVQILSTYPSGSYAYMSGTSMAAPHVTGAVALYASTHLGASAQSIRTALLSAALATPSLNGKTATGARLDLSSVITPAPVATPLPSAPSGLSTAAGINSITLNWASAANATTYIVKRSSTSGGPYTIIASVGTLSFTDSAVTANVPYYYVVAGNNTTGTGPNSAEASATPKSPAPAAPNGLSANASLATMSGSSTITVTWNATAGASSYTLKRATTSAGPWTVLASGITGTTYTQNLAANGSFYFYALSASNSGGTSPDSAPASVQPFGPAPADLTASAPSSSQVQIRWTDRSADEQGFKIEYSTSGTWYQLGTVAPGVTTVNITGTTSRRTYSFRVRAYNGTLNTSYSNSVSVTTP